MTATFEVYIDDDRYQVPTLFFIAASDAISAAEAAREMLSESEHHRGVELRCGERKVYAAGSFAQASRQDVMGPRPGAGKPTVLERAFALARSGEVQSLSGLRKQLRAEGYPDHHIFGRSLVRQLQALMRPAEPSGGGNVTALPEADARQSQK